jgi:O-antigen ligase
VPTSSGLARRLGCSGAPLGLAVLLVALAASPRFVDPFTSVKWYVLEAVAAGWLLSERLLCRGRGLPSFVRRTWIGWAVLATWVALGAVRQGPAWAVAPLVARGSFVAVTVASYWFFRRTALGLGALRGAVSAAAAVVVTLGLLQMAGLRPLPWLTGGDQRSATFGNVNMAAQFVGLAMVVLLSGLPRFAKAIHRHLADALGGASLAYVFLAGTRSVGVALAVALAVLALVRRLRVGTLVRMGAVAAALVLVLVRVDSGPLGPAAQASKRMSARLRLAVWSDTLDLVHDHPLGVGAGNFEAAFIPYALSGRSRPGARLVFRSPHNDYLRLLAEEGIGGAIVLLALLLFLLRDLHRRPAIGSWRSDAGALLASCGAFLSVEAVFQFPFEMAFPSLLAAILLGLAFAATETSLAPPTASEPSAAWPWSLFSVALALAIAAGLARLATADVLSATRHEDQAALERACALDPRRVEACVQAAWLRSRAGDHPAAQRLLEDVLAHSPDYFPAIKLLAEDLLFSGDREAGCRYARAYAALLGEASSLGPRVEEACLRPGTSDARGGS